MHQLLLTSSVVLVVLFFQGGQAAIVAVEHLNQTANATGGFYDVLPVNAVPSTVSVAPQKMCCVTILDRTDYIVTPGVGAHKYFKQAMTWNVARDICVRDGAQLAVINSDAEEKLFRTWKAANSVGGIWIGVHDLFQQDWWTTLVGEPLATMSYDIWADNRPDNAGGIEHCGVVWDEPAKGIDDCPCDRKYGFICEIELC